MYKIDCRFSRPNRMNFLRVNRIECEVVAIRHFSGKCADNLLVLIIDGKSLLRVDQAKVLKICRCLLLTESLYTQSQI